jgi:hypothetical protein
VSQDHDRLIKLCVWAGDLTAAPPPLRLTNLDAGPRAEPLGRWTLAAEVAVRGAIFLAAVTLFAGLLSCAAAPVTPPRSVPGAAFSDRQLYVCHLSDADTMSCVTLEEFLVRYQARAEERL